MVNQHVVVGALLSERWLGEAPKDINTCEFRFLGAICSLGMVYCP